MLLLILNTMHRIYKGPKKSSAIYNEVYTDFVDDKLVNISSASSG